MLRREYTHVGKNVRVTIQECEQHDIDDCQINGDENDHGLASSQQEWTIQCTSQTNNERFSADFDFGTIPLIAREVAHMLRFPSEERLRVSLWLEEHDTSQDQARDNKGDPFDPSPRENGRLGDKTTDDGAE